MVLHPKILEAKRKVGTAPFFTSKSVETPLAVREMNKNDNENPRLLRGYFAVWGEKDDYGFMPMKGCFKKSINERGPNSNANYKITMLWQHRQFEPLCKPTVIKEDEIGLYAEYIPDEGVDICDRCVIQVRSGTINQGSYGFNYVWDKMEYDEKDDSIKMYETDLFELSPVTIASQLGTFAVRNKQGVLEDPTLEEETEEFIRRVGRDKQIELRSLFSRHITLAQSQPLEGLRQALGNGKPQHGDELDLDYILNNL